ncbi:hypothetical protein [Nocardia cyriacigeorgica]|uniref:hypothetical protein n=1 Tax=Nocardia cyriacigeorgica TaxID=135487 RepID=UPI00189510B3|nr:hypothetical protein [Nocardia cyriacigeorgica]MBF6289511.1 hypothetical protein [Nocardia cyriacigeorgica]BDT85718.1 hypothetical protein FMUAM8_14820 [Nocardia cyriacigeorgica]
MNWLKSAVATTLPFVGAAVGSMVAPGIGTAVGSFLGGMAADALENGGFRGESIAAGAFSMVGGGTGRLAAKGIHGLSKAGFLDKSVRTARAAHKKADEAADKAREAAKAAGKGKKAQDAAAKKARDKALQGHPKTIPIATPRAWGKPFDTSVGSVWRKGRGFDLSAGMKKGWGPNLAAGAGAAGGYMTFKGGEALTRNLFAPGQSATQQTTKDGAPAFEWVGGHVQSSVKQMPGFTATQNTGEKTWQDSGFLLMPTGISDGLKKMYAGPRSARPVGQA